jgi:ribosomal protein L14
MIRTEVRLTVADNSGAKEVPLYARSRWNLRGAMLLLVTR